MNKNFYLSVILITLCSILSISILPIINRKHRPGEENFLAYWNSAEKLFLEKSLRPEIYNGEQIPVIETNNIHELGKLTALTFIHWIMKHPNGVIALPTGKSPEFFIKYLQYYKEHWNEANVKQELLSYGISSPHFPETKNLKLVQLSEFYPIDGNQKNSYQTYIKKFYLDLLLIPPENFLSMDLCQTGILKENTHQQIFPGGRVDLSLNHREPTSESERIQKSALEDAKRFCTQYEEKLKSWGGIGFLLSEIGQDGSIAFNMPGVSQSSKTRLVQLNYSSAASVARDLGGMEHAKDKTVVTIGLDSLIFNKDAAIILIAAGDAKAQAVANAIEQPKNKDYPSTVFQKMKGARFYLTKGAACHLEARILADIQKKRFYQLDKGEIDDIVIELALYENKRIVDLSKADFLQYPKSALLFRKFRSNLRDLLNDVRTRLIAKIEKGLKLPKNVSIVHTGPHHDDIMLSYHPVMRKLLEGNQNYFIYFTSGFNSVTNKYMTHTLDRIPERSLASYSSEIFKSDHANLLRRFINAAENNNQEGMDHVETIIMLKNICRLYDLDSITSLKEKVRWLKRDYFPRQNSWEKDSEEVQILKGAMRESESERMLLMAGASLPRIYHMRMHFYDGNYFNGTPNIALDAKPLLNLLKNLNPDIITVALDPEGMRPDTQYKALQIASQSVQMGNFSPHLKIWGYRNIWHRFKFSEANLMIPINNEDMQKMNHAFLTSFSTQKSAAFPITHFDGPFSFLAEAIQREQFQQLKKLLGEAYFLRHADPAIRNAAGFVFIKEMDQDVFLKLIPTPSTLSDLN